MVIYYWYAIDIQVLFHAQFFFSLLSTLKFIFIHFEYILLFICLCKINSNHLLYFIGDKEELKDFCTFFLLLKIYYRINAHERDYIYLHEISIPG